MVRPKSSEINFAQDEKMKKMIVGQLASVCDSEEFSTKEILCDEVETNQPAFIMFGPVIDEQSMDDTYAIAFEDELVQSQNNILLFKCKEDARAFVKHLHSSNIGIYLQYEAYLKALFENAKAYISTMTNKAELNLVCENLNFYCKKDGWAIENWIEMAVDCAKNIPFIPVKHVIYQETDDKINALGLRFNEDNSVTDALNFLPVEMLQAEEGELQSEYSLEVEFVDSLYNTAQERLACINKNFK